MKNTILNFTYNETLLSFEILKDGRIYLLYAGKERKYKKIDKNQKYFRTLVEVEMAEDERNNHFGLKSVNSAYGLTYKYVSHKDIVNSKGHEVIITTRNEYLEVETHYQFYDNVCGFSTFNVVKNISNQDATLTYVSSFIVSGLWKVNTPGLSLYRSINSWHCEAQWVKESFERLGIFTGNDWFSNKRFSIHNTGSWSTKDYLPMMIIEDKKNKEDTLVQIENSGSWNLEIGDNFGYVYYLASGPEFNDNAWKKVLKPNETFLSCQATLTYGNSFEKVIQEVTQIRRKYRRFNKDNVELPVIFNDYMHALWDTQTTELITPLVDVASEVGCDIFCMDAGWFALGSDWWDSVGEWKEYEPNFPNGGLRAVCDYIRSKGMKPGLWIEPEAVGIKSPMVKEYKDGSYFKANGRNVVVRKRYTLNFANEEVYNHMLNVVSDLVTKYDLAYIKTDYNTDVGIGNEYDSDSLGDGLLKHNRAYIKWLNEIMDKFPDLTIENCASGGCRMDSEILKYCPIQSTSDQTNFKRYPFLSVNVLTAATPEQAAVWSYPVNAQIEGYVPTDEDVAMNMCNAMLGRIHLASYINKLTRTQLNLIKDGINYFNSISKFKVGALPIIPNGIPFFFDKQVVGGLINKDKIVLGVWNTSGKNKSVKVDLSKYEVKCVNVGYPKTLKTDYVYNKETKELTVDFSTEYGARIFEIDINVA